MAKSRRIMLAVSLTIVLVSFLASILLYNSLPAIMISHWDSVGNANGYMPKFWAAFLVPFISLFLLLLFILLPKIDPLRKNIEKFRADYNKLIILLMIFMLYIHILTLLLNRGYEFNIVSMMLPSLGILFYYTGILIQNSKRNWTIGIRTQWTLSSERVWNRTNRLGGKLFKISGILAIVGFLSGKYAIFLVIVPVILSAIFLIIYSYLLYRKEKKH
ncbi:MAG: SdpI family protein [archaeon]